MIENILRLGYINDNSVFHDIAENCIKYFYHETNNMPFSSPQMLTGILFFRNSPKEIIFTGEIKNSEINKIIRYIHGKFIPFKILIHADKQTGTFVPFVKKIITDYENVNFYICENQACKLPVNNLTDLKKII